MTTVKIQILDHGMGLELPSYATRGSAGVDLRSANEGKIIVNAGMRILVSTGIAVALEEGYEAQIRPRSGLAVKFGITVLNSPGTIDSDYRGEIKVCLINLGQGIFTISRGDRIAQMVISPISQVKFIPSKELSATERGKDGFGSTGNE